jgi:hypothetical protein
MSVVMPIIKELLEAKHQLRNSEDRDSEAELRDPHRSSG